MQPTNRRSIHWALCAALALPLVSGGGLAQAQDGPRVVEGQPFARRVALAGTELQLNGTGVRAVAWFKGYAAGLYLTQPGRDLAGGSIKPAQSEWPAARSASKPVVRMARLR